ncbi:hypothetical protein CSUB01_06014 [Colletotrichum sublineola]|uniref:Uncharacterized protein n=1 Tax=Colletotrichum sublineola TaxID=1173701 RepID=A0A066XHA2_COLSU|nr:hypothetical protein CSUB01_06014 [Colletotrichum sublineola]
MGHKELKNDSSWSRAANQCLVPASHRFINVAQVAQPTTRRHSSPDQEILLILNDTSLLMVKFYDFGRPRTLVDVPEQILQRVLITLRLALYLCHG